MATIGLGVVLTAFFVGTSLQNPANAAPLVSLAALPYVALDDDCGTCGPCSLGGGESGHSASPSEGINTKGDGWHPNCLGDDCGEQHTASCECYCASDPDPEECLENCVILPGGFALGETFEDTWSGITSGRINAVEFANAYSNVEVNAARSAVQVLGCNSRVIAHIPLPTGTSAE